MPTWSRRAVVAYTPPLDASRVPQDPPDIMFTGEGDDGALLEAYLWKPNPGRGGIVEVRRFGRPLEEFDDLWPPHAPHLEELQALANVAFPALDSGRRTPILQLSIVSHGADAEYPEAREYYGVLLLAAQELQAVPRPEPVQ